MLFLEIIGFTILAIAVLAVGSLYVWLNHEHSKLQLEQLTKAARRNRRNRWAVVEGSERLACDLDDVELERFIVENQLRVSRIDRWDLTTMHKPWHDMNVAYVERD